MLRTTAFLPGLTGLIFLLTSCQNGTITTHTGPLQPVAPFPLSAVKLPDGPFKHATELNVNSLLNYEPNRLLARNLCTLPK